MPQKHCYVVTFEVGPLTNHSGFIEQLKVYGTYCPIHANAWAIVTEKSAPQIVEHLMQHIGAGARVFVIRSGTEAAWNVSYGETYTQWLKNNL